MIESHRSAVDGLSRHSPVIVNCASMGVAQAIIDRFIPSQWEKGIESTIVAPDDSEIPLRMICVKTSNGHENKFYFALSRPVGVAIKMGRL